jgi:hypothetical protein
VPDWRRIVTEKLHGLRLSAPQKEDVTAELASHLEESYEERQDSGFTESEAVEGALGEGVNWVELARQIRNAKREETFMNNRTKQLWLPGLASFWTAMICEIALSRLGFGPLTGGPMFRFFLPQLNYVVWLIAELCCGALGAYLSRRAGGTRSTRLFAALFSSAVLLTTMVIVIGICAVGRATGLAFTTLDLTMLIKPVVMVVLVPSVAMLLGALPFLSDDKHPAIAR